MEGWRIWRVEWTIINGTVHEHNWLTEKEAFDDGEHQKKQRHRISIIIKKYNTITLQWEHYFTMKGLAE